MDRDRMPPHISPVASDPVQPDRTSVVVIGGGIIGVCTAYFLAAKGVPVTLCEKGEIAAEQSSRNWGWCRKMGRDPREVPLAIEALRLWHDMNRAVGGETGFRRSGIVYLCKTQADVEKRESWLDLVARGHQLDSKLVTRDQAARILPGLAGSSAGALFTPSDRRAEPSLAAPAIAEAARRNGATILTRCAVRGIETAAGRVTGVVTEHGRIACDSVVLAGGIWSSLFCGNLDLHLPQLKVLSAVMRTAPLPAGPETSVGGPSFGLRKRLDGGYTVANWSDNVAELVPDSFRFGPEFRPLLKLHRDSIRVRLGRQFLQEWRTPRRWALDAETPFEQTRIYDPAPRDDILHNAQDAVSLAFPVFHDMEVVETWGGAIDVTPDAVPVISGVDTIPGFFIATGFSGHGFGIAPGAGRLMAELVMGETPVVDPSPFRYNRFIDGSRPQPSPLA
jgi:glycine/D-amino acid oxidase-like deaminating enzyme